MGAGDLGCDLCERGVGLATEEIALVGDIDDVASALPVSHEAPTGAQLWPGLCMGGGLSEGFQKAFAEACVRGLALLEFEGEEG